MVLQDTETPADSFADNPPPSNDDAYTSSAPSGQRFDASSFPQPIPILGPLTGHTSTYTRRKTEQLIKFSELLINRTMTPVEAQALARRVYRFEEEKSRYAIAATAIGVGRWYQTMQSYRYPFYKPEPKKIDPNKFLLLKGPAAQYARHSWRLLCYVTVASHLGKLVGQTVSHYSAGEEMSNDPELAQFALDLKKAASTEHTNKKTVLGSVPEQRRRWMEEAARARNAERSAPGAPTQVPWNARKPTPADDDMSPTAGSDPWPSSSNDSWSGSAFPEDPAPAVQPRQQSSDPYSQLPGGQPRYNRNNSDDTSPTGGMFQDEVESKSKSGESAWDRLRRGDAPPSLANKRQPPYQDQRDGSTLGDSFTFVGSKEERRSEKERAQREFDARIEHERLGKDFDDDKKW